MMSYPLTDDITEQKKETPHAYLKNSQVSCFRQEGVFADFISCRYLWHS